MLDRFADGSQWHKSTHSGESDCVEVAVDGHAVRVRDSQRPGVELTFTVTDWTAFLQILKSEHRDGYPRERAGRRCRAA
jgi:hypothetical protein